MHDLRLVSFDEDRRVAIAFQEFAELFRTDPRQHCRIGDLVAVEMQNRENGSVRDGIKELVAMPGSRKRTGLGLAIADDAGHDQVGIVKYRAISVGQRIAELPAFMNRSWRLGGGMARDSAREGELAEQPAHPSLVLRDIRIELAISAFEPSVGDHARCAMARSGDEQDVEIPRLDDAVEMDIDEIEARRRSPMTEETWLDVLDLQWLAQQWIGKQIYLADRQIIGGAPPSVQHA